MTPLDIAAARMAAGGEAEARAFYATLRAAELSVVLEDGADETLKVLETSDGMLALAFDTELRMADFLGGPAAFLQLSGRRLAALLDGRGVALGLNFGAPSETILPAKVLTWLTAMQPPPAEQRALQPESVSRPRDVPQPLLAALDRALASLAGLAEAAYLVEADYGRNGQGLLLAVPGAPPGAEAAIAEVLTEALAFSGLEAAALDIAFPQVATVPALARSGLRFDLPTAERVLQSQSAPPRLR